MSGHDLFAYPSSPILFSSYQIVEYGLNAILSTSDTLEQTIPRLEKAQLNGAL